LPHLQAVRSPAPGSGCLVAVRHSRTLAACALLRAPVPKSPGMLAIPPQNR
jgi:hypothetical protein